MTAIIFKPRLNFCPKEQLKTHCHEPDCLVSMTLVVDIKIRLMKRNFKENE